MVNHNAYNTHLKAKIGRFAKCEKPLEHNPNGGLLISMGPGYIIILFLPHSSRTAYCTHLIKCFLFS